LQKPDSTARAMLDSPIHFIFSENNMEIQGGENYQVRVQPLILWR
jgi:hypothetical protein